MLNAADPTYVVHAVGKDGKSFAIDAVVICTDGTVALAISPVPK